MWLRKIVLGGGASGNKDAVMERGPRYVTVPQKGTVQYCMGRNVAHGLNVILQ